MAEEQQGYSAWLGGYAKSMGNIAGSVTSFTKDILEEQRQDVQDVHSQLKFSIEQIEKLETKVKGHEDEITRLKSQVLESRESKEVSELQIQELGNRWKQILQEKEEEVEMLKKQALEQEGEKKARASPPLCSVGRRRNMSEDLDYSDPFQCEVEITRLATENDRLSAQLSQYTTQATESATVDTEDMSLKLQALRSELRSVHSEHQNELAARDFSRLQEIDQMRVEYEALLGDKFNTGLEEVPPKPLLNSTSNIPEREEELQSIVEELEGKLGEANNQRKREHSFLLQVEQERDALSVQLTSLKHELTASLTSNTELTAHLEGQVEEVSMTRDKLTELQELYDQLDRAVKLKDANTASEDQNTEQIVMLELLLSDKAHNISQLQVQLNGIQLQLSNRDREINQLRIALNNVNDENFQEIRASADSLKTQVEGYKESLREAGHQLLNSNERCVILSEEIVSLKDSVDRVEGLNEKMDGMVQVFENMDNEKTASLAHLNITLSSLETELRTATESSNILSEENLKLETTTNKLKADNLSLVVNNKKLNEEVSNFDEKIKILSEQHEIQLKSAPVSLPECSEYSFSKSTIYNIFDHINSSSLSNETVSFSESQLEHIRNAMLLQEDSVLEPDETERLQQNVDKLEFELNEKISIISSLQENVEEKIMRIKELELEQKDLVWESENRRKKLENEIEKVGEECEGLRTEVATLKEDLSQTILAQSDDSLQLKYEQLELSAKKEKERLVEEISRIMVEMEEVEEVYASTVTKAEVLEEEMRISAVKMTTLTEEKERGDAKIEKMAENLKKVLGRLSVKESKIDELSSEVQRLEADLKRSQEEVLHFKHNQTDEIKAAQLGLDKSPPLTEEVAQFSSPKKAESTAVDDLVKAHQKLSENEKSYESLLEKSKDKDLKIEVLKSELSSLTEEAASFSSAHASNLIDQHSALMRKMMGVEEERDGLKQEHIELTHQRDFYKDQAVQFHTSMEHLRDEANRRISDTNEREVRVQGDLERLQKHCMQIEALHTQDVIESAERETALNKEMQTLREEIKYTNTALQSLRSDTLEESGGLHEQLYILSSQRDEAVLSLSSLEDRAHCAESSLNNLQLVLEQFQREKDSYAEEVKDQYRSDLSSLTEQLYTARSNVETLQVRVAESTVLEQDIENCKHQLNLKEERIKSLRGEVSKLDVALKVAQEGLRKAMTSSDEKVDRSLIKNFFTQYVTVSDDRRQDVLRVISAILGYTEEELKEIEIARQNHGRWLPTLFSGPKNKQPVQPAPVGESFSELFISFLETEANKATLPPRVRTTSQQYRPVSTPPVMGHMRTTSSSSVGSPRSSSPVTTTIKSKALDSRRSPSVSSGHDSMSPPHSAAATPLVPSSLADLLSTKNP